VTNHINLGGFLCATAPLTLALLGQWQRWWQRLVLILGFGVQVAGLILTYSRAAWVGLALAMLLLTILLIAKRLSLRILLPGIGLSVIIALVAWVSLGESLTPTQTRTDIIAYRLGTLLQPFQTQEMAGRLNVWQRSLTVLSTQPLLGAGRDTLPDRDLNWWGAQASSHNLFINVAFSRGVIAFAAFMVLLIGLGVSGARVYRAGRDWAGSLLGAGLLAGLAAFVVAGLFASLVAYADTGALFWLLAGVVVMARRLISDYQPVLT